ncbi:hydantoinase/oxoprolinase family protein [Phreatobacter sp. AB_2022a]|uniref:hydantoinase/oxoprolinase family protein n=1 Tax=Phreatobacter sp. AB_2022a TaxID=3003134 RepID=UPI002286E05B|nr:hydantoinase/oxoprolinase family protein [Phreatobacter sp. AB_2022a]MCZ0733131.1 hydantoinase/oxoprolinase family protein [Phreatobacter sp. AB_2022a]
MKTRLWDIGTDIGGTFTDIIAVRSDTNETRIAKVPSRPDAPVTAMLEALAAVRVGPDDVRRFVHGTTRVTNALVEERLPKVALVATAGFEDVLEIARYRREELYRLDVPPKAAPLVPASLCFGVKERLDHRGEVIEPLADAEIDRLIAWLEAHAVESVAVCLLHSYANPAHEKRIAERLAGVVPHVCVSHEINPEAREYERASSTAFNAAAMPIAVEYLTELEQRLPLGAGLQVFHSAGAMVPVPAVKRRPLVMAMSGPAAGVSASARIARDLQRPRVLTFDMGGTTTDVCLIVDGVAEMTDTRMMGGRPLRQPMLAVHSIGAGGGSIVDLGPGGLTVGPKSAGSVPGPACYGRGGDRPTITDANAVLGYLDPEARLGDTISLDVEAARRVIAPIARQLDLGLAETALGIVKVAGAAMARALRRVTVERGVDGRDCTLLAFGGGGPMHAAGLADIYGLSEIIVPAASSAFSALGCLTADFSFLQQRTVRMSLADFPHEAFAARVAELSAEATAPLIANGIAPADIAIEHVALMRYAAQSDSIPIGFAMPLDRGVLEADFHRRHQDLFGYATSEDCVIESVRIQALKPSSVPFSRPDVGRAPVQPRQRDCVFEASGPVATAIVARETLAGAVTGPAIIEDAWSTVVVPPGWQARPDALGNLFMTRSAA